MTDKDLEPIKLGPMRMVENQEISPLNILSQMAANNASPENIRMMMDMAKEWEDREAKKAYVKAMTEFKKNPPNVYKTAHVEFGNTNYNHAELANACEIIGNALATVGIAHGWKQEQLDGQAIKVTCTLTHELGHSESTALQSAPDASGGKNAIQAIGSTSTYLQRYTLFAITGLAAKGMDDDGRGSEPELEIEYIDEEQQANIQALLDDVGADKDGFLKFCKADSIATISTPKYSGAIAALQAKRKK